MPPTIQAAVSFDAASVEELVREHLESQGYYVESISEDDEQGYNVSVRPMTEEELALHNLPTASLEDRLQAKIDSLVEGMSSTFARFQQTLDKQARDTEHALEHRLDDLQDLSEHLQESFREIQQLAEQQAARPVPAPQIATQAPSRPGPGLFELEGPPSPAPGYEEPEPVRFSDPVQVAPTGPGNGISYETLSFADAAASLGADAKANNPTDNTRQKRYEKLHRELEREAAEAEEDEEREHIPGESSAFPSDLATQ